MQYTKAHIRHPLVLLANKTSGENKDERAVLKQRPARPFTHASHERANDIFHDGMYHMSDKRNLPLAERHFRQVIKIDPNHVGALSYLGIIEQDHRQNYSAAAELFLRALALEPNNPVALGGYALWQQNCECNQASNLLWSRSESCFFFIADEMTKNQEEAEEYFSRAVACDPLDPYNQANYGLFLKTVRKDETQSRKYMQAALKIDPDRPWFRNNVWKF